MTNEVSIYQNFTSIFFCSISNSERQLFGAEAEDQHPKLQEFIERTYPNLDNQQWHAVYRNIVLCMDYKKHVRSTEKGIFLNR